MNTGKRVLVLGATGMLGNAVLRYFASRGEHVVAGTVRSQSGVGRFPVFVRSLLIPDVDVENTDSVARVFGAFHPDVVINCIGLVKQLVQADDPLVAIPVNSLLPHRLARLCAIRDARLVHVSTDCVFGGGKGMYVESDAADALDLYGRSKLLGEVDCPNAVTLRTSIIGHELGSAHGLIEWFLSQQGAVCGFSKAIFSGLPTVELARVMHDYVLPNPNLQGVYHVSTSPIDKHSLLKLVAQVYAKEIAIAPDEKLVSDRSLDSTRFRSVTGYVPADWDVLVADMHKFG